MYQDQATSYRPFGHTETISGQEQAKWQAHIAMEQIAKQSPQLLHGPLEGAISSLANGLDEAFAAVDRLSERLEPVLQPEVPTPIGNSVKDCSAPPTSTSVTHLHALRSTLERLICRINATNARLDT